MNHLYGLTEEQLNELKSKLIEPLKNKKARVFLFGSRANGKYKKFSDIDLFYIPSHSLPIPESFIYQLLSSIEESHFPFKIDLVKYENIAASYRANIDHDKIEL